MNRYRIRRRQALGAVVLAVTLGTVGLVWMNGVLLGQMIEQVSTAQVRLVTLAKSGRETLLLQKQVGELGTLSTPKQMVVQSGIVDRHLQVTIASMVPNSAEARELAAVRDDLRSIDWDGLAAGAARDPALREHALVLLAGSEHTVNNLRNAAEQQYYLATLESLKTKQRAQVGLTALVAVVLGLGVSGFWILTRRSRTRTEQAYEQLRGQIVGREAAEEALRASEGRFRSLVQRASDLTVLTDDAGTIIYISPAAEVMLGRPPTELIGNSLLDLVEVEQRADIARAIERLARLPGRLHTVELRLGTVDGSTRSVEAVCQNLVNEADVGGLVWNGRDVTERRVLEDELIRQAHHDSLTGLPNRVLLLKRLAEVMRFSSPTSTSSVLLVDLDGFKHVNDTLGHPAGDVMLQIAAGRLLGCIESDDTVARLGGDEFAVLAVDRAPGRAKLVGDRLVEVLGQPFAVAGREVRVSASVGIAHCSGSSAADLLRDADIAMYAAKNTGKGRIEVFDPSMRDRASHRTSLQQDVARVVELGELEVHYQPIVDLKSFRPLSLEALARWRRHGGPLIPADVFIPIAEETGAIIEIGREVLRQACQAMQLWRGSIPGCAELGVAVNVSVHQVLSGRLLDHVTEALRASDLPASALTLEITESSPLESSQRVTAEFERLRELGVRISVDDFGAGYSSLSFMMGLKADVLKIDRSLLDFDTLRRGSLVTAIAELGRTLGLVVVVEGVETSDHLARALEASCDAAQGFHFSRPLPFAEVPGLLARHELGA